MFSLILFALGVPMDCLIKRKVERELEEQQIVPVFGGIVTFRNYHNRGAMLEVGKRKNRLVAVLSTTITAVVLGVYLVLLVRSAGTERLKAALALVAGGGLCNTIDRLSKGYVVDYISFGRKIRKRGKIVYNLSDFCIFTGALLLALEELN